MAPQDHGFKDAFKKDPRGLLHIIGSLPLSAKGEIETVSPELLAPGEARMRTIRLIRGFLKRTYPKLAAHPAIDRIATIERAEQVLERLYGAKTERAALTAIAGRRAMHTPAGAIEG